jgi:prepilin-type N-terminal cleavage/methylation domain-containing protein
MKPSDNRGFTLVELMVVIGLLVMFGMVTSSFDTENWLANYRLRGAARDLYSRMNKARMNAIKENRSWGILFDTANNTYQLQFLDDTGNWIASGEPAVSLGNQYGSGVSFGHGAATVTATDPPGTNWDDNVTFTANRATFNPQGFANSGYCYLTNSDNGAYAVGSLTSGSVRIRKWNNGWQQ